jgi:D-glycero-D-manno-heptose 1,7-bisphosphate phosphatase
LGRKPGCLLFEKAIARFQIDIAQTWMIGDKERDLTPAFEVGIKKLIRLFEEEPDPQSIATHQCTSLQEAVQFLTKR